MPDQPRSFTIQARSSCAVWPGDGIICVRVSAPKWFPDMLWLVDREDRYQELRVYKVGMFRR